MHTAESEDEQEAVNMQALIARKKEILKNQKPRASVSAEVFGEWNKKGDFEAKNV